MSGAPAHLLTTLFMAAAAMGYPSRRSATDLDATPRTTVTFDELSEVRRFNARTLNYSTLLLEDDRGILYVGARGAIFALNSSDVADGSHRTIHWEASPEKQMDCLQKGKNNKTECFNHVRFLQRLNSTHLYACGTYAFHPLCAAIVSTAHPQLPPVPCHRVTPERCSPCPTTSTHSPTRFLPLSLPLPGLRWGSVTPRLG